MKGRLAALFLITAAALFPTTAARAAGTVATTFPADFPVPRDASLGVPVLGFGAKGPVNRTPVIFLHGNNDTSHPTVCNSAFGKIHSMAQYFADRGYSTSELWGLSYQGEQCDIQMNPLLRAGEAHTAKANTPDLRAFANAVMAYTGASQVDLIGHSLGATLSREWMRQYAAYPKVRSMVGIDGPEHGIINCSPSPQNYYVSIGFFPDSPVCLEFGSVHTPLLTTLNAVDETPGTTRYLTIRNADVSFVFIPKQDGSFPPVPAEDRDGRPHDFSMSAKLNGARNIDLFAQGKYDGSLLTAHLGIINSPETWKAAYEFLNEPVEGTASPLAAAPASPSARLAATGPGPAAWPVGVALLIMGLLLIRSVARARPEA